MTFGKNLHIRPGDCLTSLNRGSCIHSLIRWITALWKISTTAFLLPFSLSRCGKIFDTQLMAPLPESFTFPAGQLVVYSLAPRLGTDMKPDRSEKPALRSKYFIVLWVKIDIQNDPMPSEETGRKLANCVWDDFPLPSRDTHISRRDYLPNGTMCSQTKLLLKGCPCSSITTPPLPNIIWKLWQYVWVILRFNAKEGSNCIAFRFATSILHATRSLDVLRGVH